jgi:hypothetical protein
MVMGLYSVPHQALAARGRGTCKEARPAFHIFFHRLKTTYTKEFSLLV